MREEHAHPKTPRRSYIVGSQLLSSVLWIAVVFAIFYVLNNGKNFLIPLVVAFLAVYLIHTLSSLISAIPIGQRHIPTSLAVVLSFVCIFFFGYGLFSIVAENALSMANEAPRYQTRLNAWLHDVFAHFGMKEPDAVSNFLRSFNLQRTLTTVAGSVAGLLGNITLVFLYSLFMVIELRFLPRKLDALFPDPGNRTRIANIIQRIDSDVRTYLTVKTIISLITAGLSYVVMRLVGLDFAEFWALLIFILNFIPAIGSIVATILPSLMALVQFDKLGPFLAIVIGITAIQQTLGNIIEPNIMGQTLNLSPLVVVMTLILWGSIWGIVGMFLCVPLTVILVIILSNFESTRWVAILLSRTGRIRLVEEKS